MITQREPGSQENVVESEFKLLNCPKLRHKRGIIGSIAAVAFGLAFVAVAGYAWHLQGASSTQGHESTISMGDENISKTVSCLGRLEPMGELIKLNAPSSSREGLVSELKCEEGDRIKKGQVLAVLDCVDRLKANVEQCQGQLAVAKARLAITKSGAKQGEIESQRFEIKRIQADLAAKISSQNAVLAKLESSYRQSVIDCGRYEFLFKEKAVSSFDYDQKKLAMETALQNLNEAKGVLQQIQTTELAAIESARATLKRIEEVRPVDVDAASAEVRQAEGSLAQARAALEHAYVRSPLDGKVLKIYSRPGEKIGEEGFADVGRTQNMYAVAEVYQSDINKIHLGQSVSIEADSLPGCRLAGTVKRIGQEVRRQDVINADPSANIDERVVEVRVQLDAKSSSQVQHLSNSQVTAIIRL